MNKLIIGWLILLICFCTSLAEESDFIEVYIPTKIGGPDLVEKDTPVIFRGYGARLIRVKKGTDIRVAFESPVNSTTMKFDYNLLSNLISLSRTRKRKLQKSILSSASKYSSSITKMSKKYSKKSFYLWKFFQEKNKHLKGPEAKGMEVKNLEKFILSHAGTQHTLIAANHSKMSTPGENSTQIGGGRIITVRSQEYVKRVEGEIKGKYHNSKELEAAASERVSEVAAEARAGELELKSNTGAAISLENINSPEALKKLLESSTSGNGTGSSLVNQKVTQKELAESKRKFKCAKQEAEKAEAEAEKLTKEAEKLRQKAMELARLKGENHPEAILAADLAAEAEAKALEARQRASEKKTEMNLAKTDLQTKEEKTDLEKLKDFVNKAKSFAVSALKSNNSFIARNYANHAGKFNHEAYLIKNKIQEEIRNLRLEGIKAIFEAVRNPTMRNKGAVKKIFAKIQEARELLNEVETLARESQTLTDRAFKYAEELYAKEARAHEK